MSSVPIAEAKAGENIQVHDRAADTSRVASIVVVDLDIAQAWPERITGRLLLER